MNIPTTTRRGLVFNADPFRNLTVGFDSIFDQLSSMSNFEAPSYPPYNIRKLGTDGYELEMALAGFTKGDINVEVKEDVLTISASKESKDEEESFLHKGIAKRAFTRKWTLAEHLEVKDAEFKDGILLIKMKLNLPEEKKSKTIKIK
tara:strand:+ start:39 stop:479 length:441 start_codon:yes stop_codon:yes gene_type:complete